ncbi:hypothetical protein [Polyangium sp. 6x1]|uniref:hypothetical protein n=1 Tax=Polyangium sp. 6x1 TaxID=3042689 RepID=UPI0024822A13|nr:hypothetical protein [Polyangium sp. 6x1]MDI1444708.1 hypothetical protein [Polyangium sp. 6x1]
MSSPDSDAPGASDAGGHPLFPRPETATGPDRRKFDLIQIRRWGPDGKMEVCPKTFKGSELRTYEQIVDMYGGGEYQLVAQDQKTHQFQAYSDRMRFPGPSKPFVDVPPAPPPSPAHAPQGYYTAPSPYPGTGGSEMIAMMRVMFESNAAVQTAVLKLLVDSKQDGGSNVQTVLVSKLLDRLLERQAQNPLELLRETVPLLQSLTGGGGDFKKFMQGVEFTKEMLGSGGTSKSDDLGELASLIKTFMTMKASAAPTNAAPAPTPTSFGPQPATQSAPARPRKQRKSQPPTTTPPGYPAAFPPWPWPYLPAHLYGMMHPAYQAWAAAYAQTMGSHPVVPPARPSAPPSASRPAAASASPVVPQTAPTSTTPHEAPATPAPPPAAASAPTVAGHVAADEELAVLSSTVAVMAEPAVADEELAAAPMPVVAEPAVADEEPAMADAADDGFTRAQEEFDPFASLRAMLANLHASQPSNPLAQDPSAMAVATPLVQPPGFPALHPMQRPLTGMPVVPPVDMATAFALYLSTLQSNPYGVPPPAPAAEPLVPDEEEDDDDDDADGDLPEDGSTVAMPGVIAMAAADSEFETTLPEELRPILRALMGKPGGGGLS